MRLLKKSFVRVGGSLTIPAPIDPETRALSAWIYVASSAPEDGCMDLSSLFMVGQSGICLVSSSETLCVVEHGQVVARVTRGAKWYVQGLFLPWTLGKKR